jgi:hypothetical protein
MFCRGYWQEIRGIINKTGSRKDITMQQRFPPVFTNCRRQPYVLTVFRSLNLILNTKPAFNDNRGDMESAPDDTLNDN